MSAILPCLKIDSESHRRLTSAKSATTSAVASPSAAATSWPEQQRLALEQAKALPEQEKLFWEWTERPDIQAKLYPHRDPDQTRRDVVRLLDHQLLGVKPPGGALEADPDPACFI